MNIITKIRREYIFVAIVTLLCSCIKENLTNCDNVAICVRYFADSQTDVLAKYIDNIHLISLMTRAIGYVQKNTIYTIFKVQGKHPLLDYIQANISLSL